MKDEPDIQIVVVNGASPVLMDHLKSGKVDLAFASGPIDDDAFDTLLLRENSYCLYLPADHPLAQAESIAPELLAGERIVIPSQHFSPATYEIYYQPVVDAGIVPVAVPEFQCAVTYAADWHLPVMCTRYAAERHAAPDFVVRPLPFVPPCKKYLVRLKDHRTPSQSLLWDMARTTADPARTAH